jgi:hypothetical protein
MPVNRTAMTSVAMRKIANKERSMFKTGRDRVKAMNALKRLVRNMYMASLNAATPAFSNYQRRAGTPAGFKRMTKSNLNKLLFRK